VLQFLPVLIIVVHTLGLVSGHVLSGQVPYNSCHQFNKVGESIVFIKLELSLILIMKITFGTVFSAGQERGDLT